VLVGKPEEARDVNPLKANPFLVVPVVIARPMEIFLQRAFGEIRTGKQEPLQMRRQVVFVCGGNASWGTTRQ
jgi:hypothetical protein